MKELQVYARSAAMEIPMWFYGGLMVVICFGCILLQHGKKERDAIHSGAILLMGGWILLVFSSTVLFRETGMDGEISLIPLSSYYNYAPNSYFIEKAAMNLLNVVLFIPLGINK